MSNAGVALMQEVGLFFVRQSFRNPRFKRGLLGVVRQQIAKVDTAIPEQAQMQLTNGGDAKTVTAGTKVFLIRHDKPDFPFVIRVTKNLRRAVAALTNLVDPAAFQQLITQHHPGDVMPTEQLTALAGFHQLDKTQLDGGGI